MADQPRGRRIGDGRIEGRRKRETGCFWAQGRVRGLTFLLASSGDIQNYFSYFSHFTVTVTVTHSHMVAVEVIKIDRATRQKRRRHWVLHWSWCGTTNALCKLPPYPHHHCSHNVQRESRKPCSTQKNIQQQQQEQEREPDECSTVRYPLPCFKKLLQIQ